MSPDQFDLKSITAAYFRADSVGKDIIALSKYIDNAYYVKTGCRKSETDHFSKIVAAAIYAMDTKESKSAKN